MRLLSHLALVFFSLLTLTGCATWEMALPANSSEPDKADLPCAYFYFLWGTHAEYSQHFAGALEAYEKALICDPKASYIQKKLPVLLIKMGETEKAVSWLRKAIVEDPDDSSLYLLLAHLNIQQNKRDEAVLLYREVLKREPDNEGVLLRLGILYSQQNQLQEAEKIFRDLLKNNSELYFAHVYLARLLHQMRSLSEAAKEYEHALRLNWSAELVYEMVEFYTAQDKYEDVLRLYTTITENDATNEQGALGRIQTLLSLGKEQQAIEELRQIRSQSREPAKIDMAISKVLLRLGKIDEAQALLKTLQEGLTASEASYMLGLIAFQVEDFEQAISYLSAIERDSTEYAEGIYLQVRILRHMDQHARALTLLEDCLTDPPHRHPIFYALLSSLYQEQKRDDEALNVLIDGTTTFPDNEQLHFEHALLLERRGNHLEAVTSMQKVLELQPDHPEALNFIGYTWADQNQHLDQAYEYIRKAVELKPENGYIRDSLGWVYYRLGNLEKAQNELLKALELEPEDPHIYDHLGDVYHSLGLLDEALNAYQKALEMFDDALEKAAIQKKIDELTAK